MNDPVIPAQNPYGGVNRPARNPDLEPEPPVSERPGASELQALAELAERLNGDSASLLDLLRRLEQLHRSIQDGPFRDSLPSDRNRLYRLLESMEDSGGWPYIPRLQLRTFMELLQRGDDPEGQGSEQPPLAA
jgi:hypothetical protein